MNDLTRSVLEEADEKMAAKIAAKFSDVLYELDGKEKLTNATTILAFSAFLATSFRMQDADEDVVAIGLAVIDDIVKAGFEAAKQADLFNPELTDK